MLTAVRLTERERRSLAQGIGPLLAHSLAAAKRHGRSRSAPTRFAIGESFDIWVVDAAALHDSRADADVRVLARQSARTHHQLFALGRPIGWARSVHLDGRRAVHGVAVSHFARLVHRAIDRLEAMPARRGALRPGGTVRLLTIPSAHVTALWVAPRRAAEASRVLLLEAPRGLRVARTSLVDSVRLLQAVRRITERRTPSSLPE